MGEGGYFRLEGWGKGGYFRLEGWGREDLSGTKYLQKTRFIKYLEFRIRRGTDECAVESIAVEAFPIP